MAAASSATSPLSVVEDARHAAASSTASFQPLPMSTRSRSQAASVGRSRTNPSSIARSSPWL